MANGKSFTIVKNISKSFTLVVDGFSQLLTWVATVNVVNVSISAVMKVIARITSTLNFHNVGISAIPHLKNKLSTTISFYVNSTISAISLLIKNSVSVSYVDMSINAEPSSLYKVSVSSSIPMVASISGMLVGVYNYLGDFVGRNPDSIYFDADILGDLDSLTLGEMDFTET
jgi:hypothetical protein